MNDEISFDEYLKEIEEKKKLHPNCNHTSANLELCDVRYDEYPNGKMVKVAECICNKCGRDVEIEGEA